MQRDDVANAVSDVAVGKNVEPHTNPRSHLFSSAPTKIAQAPLSLNRLFTYYPQRVAAKILRAPIYYFNFNPRRDRMCHRRRLINAARGNLLLAKFLLLSCFYARAFLAFFPRAHRASVREWARACLFSDRESSQFYFRPIKITRVYTMFYNLKLPRLKMLPRQRISFECHACSDIEFYYCHINKNKNKIKL